MHVGSDGDGERYTRRGFTRLSHQSSNAALLGGGGTDRHRSVAGLPRGMGNGLRAKGRGAGRGGCDCCSGEVSRLDVVEWEFLRS
jgi:hypothetical protein